MAEVVNIRDGVCAYLQGGFGNQLFILAAAWDQAERLGCPLYVDMSRFLGSDPLERAETPWPYDLGSLDHPGIVIGKESPWFKNSPRRPRLIRRPGRSSGTLAVYRQPSFGYHQNVDEIRPGTTLFGYFQSPHYFRRVSERVREMLWSAEMTDAETSVVRDAAADPKVTLHMRRGDYLDPKIRAYHGIASEGYFLRSLALLDKLVPGVGGRVFSDSMQVAREEVGEHPGMDFFDAQSRLGTIATIQAMASGRAFVMSNSSFSWWAAWLMAGQDESVPVVAPRPWQTSGESASDLLLPAWLTLDAR